VPSVCPFFLLQPVPEKLKLEMVVEMENEIFDGQSSGFFSYEVFENDHRGFLFVFRRPFRVSSFREQATEVDGVPIKNPKVKLSMHANRAIFEFSGRLWSNWIPKRNGQNAKTNHLSRSVSIQRSHCFHFAEKQKTSRHLWPRSKICKCGYLWPSQMLQNVLKKTSSQNLWPH